MKNLKIDVSLLKAHQQTVFDLSKRFKKADALDAIRLKRLIRELSLVSPYRGRVRHIDVDKTASTKPAA